MVFGIRVDPSKRSAPDIAVSGDGRSGSSQPQAIVSRTLTIADGLERWVIAPAALADQRRLLDRCRSLC
eukprot:6052777-Prymnesium_polylepis.1